MAAWRRNGENNGAAKYHESENNENMAAAK
jgi:hypothetical protein